MCRRRLSGGRFHWTREYNHPDRPLPKLLRPVGSSSVLSATAGSLPQYPHLSPLPSTPPLLLNEAEKSPWMPYMEDSMLDGHAQSSLILGPANARRSASTKRRKADFKRHVNLQLFLSAHRNDPCLAVCVVLASQCHYQRSLVADVYFVPRVVRPDARSSPPGTQFHSVRTIFPVSIPPLLFKKCWRQHQVA